MDCRCPRRRESRGPGPSLEAPPLFHQGCFIPENAPVIMVTSSQLLRKRQRSDGCYPMRTTHYSSVLQSPWKLGQESDLILLIRQPRGGARWGLSSRNSGEEPRFKLRLSFAYCKLHSLFKVTFCFSSFFLSSKFSPTDSSLLHYHEFICFTSLSREVLLSIKPLPDAELS